eukprot:5198026-Amphidinium_carterae.1
MQSTCRGMSSEAEADEEDSGLLADQSYNLIAAQELDVNGKVQRILPFPLGGIVYAQQHHLETKTCAPTLKFPDQTVLGDLRDVKLDKSYKVQALYNKRRSETVAEWCLAMRAPKFDSGGVANGLPKESVRRALLGRPTSL